MASDQSLAAYVAFILVILCPVCVFIVFFYAEPGFPWHSYITLIMGFYAAFGILLMIPIDIAVVISDRSSTSTGHDTDYDYHVNTLSDVYNTFFTVVLVMGSVVLVFEEYYNTDGYFTVGGKLWSAFKRMCFDLFVPMVVGLIILGILIGQKVVSSNADALKLAAIIVTNTMYELFLMFLLGYALVEFPRWIWSQSNIDGYLLKTQTKAAQQFKDISEAQLNVSLCVSDVLKTKTAITAYGDPALNAAMEVLIADCPPEFRSDRQGKVAADKKGKITVDSLAQLRTRLNVLKDAYKMAQAKVEGTKLLSYNLEDLAAAKNNPAAQVIHWSVTDKDSTPNEYFWHVRAKPILLKFLALLCGGLSFLSFLGVVCSMQGVSNNVSPYFDAVHSDSASTADRCVFVFLTFGYTIYITTWAIFEIKLGAAYELVPGRTTPEALSFNVRMVARLAAPLAFFYLGWIAENGIRTGSWTSNDAPITTYLQNVTVSNGTTSITFLQNTTTTAISMPSAFSKFYQLENVSSVQEVFGTIFPIILYIVLGLFVLNIFNRILVFLKLDNYQFGAQIITDEQLREGKRQLQRHKASTIRRFRRGELKTLISTLTGKRGENEEKGGCCSSICSVFFAKSSTNRETISSNSDVVAESQPTVQEPSGLSGLIERKGGFSLGGSSWKEIYAEVRSPGFLHFYKDKKAADQNRFNDPSRNSDPQITIVDLRSVVDFAVPEKKNKDNLELELVTATESIRLKFRSVADVEKWKKGLAEWKDFNMDYGLAPAADPELGRSSVNVKQKESNTATNPLIRSSAPVTNDLESIHIEEDEEDHKGVKPLIRGSSQKKESVNATASKHISIGDDKPEMLEGWLEKKGNGKMVGGDWQKRFVKIDEGTGTLVYSKSSDPKDKPSGQIDLKFVKDITPYDKSGKADSSRFNVDVGDKVYKFKAQSEVEGKRWIDGLHAWRDYFLMNMT